MARQLRRTLIVTSALLCLATLLLWGRSYVAHDMVEAHRSGEARGRAHDDIRGVISQRGAIGGGYVRIDHPGVPGFADRWMHTANAPPNPWPLRVSFLGFSYWSTTRPASAKHGPVHAVGVTVPHALLIVLLAIAPTRAALRSWRARRAGHPSVAGPELSSRAKLRGSADARSNDRAGVTESWPAAAAPIGA